MIPIKQTILHDPANGVHGNCFSAVLASLLHVDIATVPVFSNPATWERELNDWLRPFNLAYMQLRGFPGACRELNITGMHHEMAGNTNRSGDVLHAVVAVDGKAVFDPHPDASGLTNETACGIFMALEPWQLIESARQNAVQAERIKKLEAHIQEAADRTAEAALSFTPKTFTFKLLKELGASHIAALKQEKNDA